jgi:predicted benzoate:H+ symporter BenE
MWHVAAVSFWFGVVGAEFVVERSRADSRPHGYSVARNHYWIDVLLEVPVALVVLVTGVMLLQVTPVTPWFLIKILAGLLAVAVNVVCLVPVIKRKAAADEERLSDVIRYSAVIDRITVVGLPAALIALMIGLLH